MKHVALWCGLLLLFSGVASAQDNPRAEVFGGYSYLRVNAVGTEYDFNGGSGSLSYNPNGWLGLVGDFGGYYWSQSGVDGTGVTYLFGPKFAYRTRKFTPFAQTLFGGAHFSGSTASAPMEPGVARPRPEVLIIPTGPFGSTSADGFAMALGGGLDWNATHHIGIRLIQAEYLYTRIGVSGVTDHQNNARISAGFVFRW
jgi:Outer membrane protein beta-barrel domain